MMHAGVSGLWTSIAAVKSFARSVLNPPPESTHFIWYTTGATAALKNGETLTGGTSSAKLYLVYQSVEVGTAGSSDTGLLYIRILSGTPAAAGETWTGSATTGTVATAQAPILISTQAQPPKAAVITIEGTSAIINYTLDGTNPTVTSGTNLGHQYSVSSGQNLPLVIEGTINVLNFKCIDAKADNSAKIKWTILY